MEVERRVGRPRNDGEPTVCRTTAIECLQCDKRIRSGTIYRKHLLTSHRESLKKFECKTCSLRFLKQVELLHHLVSHWSDGEACPLVFEDSCTDIKFTRRAKLLSHLLQKHMAKIEDRVDVKYARDVNRTKRNAQNVFVCVYCCKSFVKLSLLTRHIRIHTGEKPFVCTFCDIKFNQKSSLITHVRTHTNLKNYKCPCCPQTFIQKGNLNTHLKNQHPTIPSSNSFTCKYCSCSYRKKAALKRHNAALHKTLTQDQILNDEYSVIMEDLAILQQYQNDSNGNEDFNFLISSSIDNDHEFERSPLVSCSEENKGRHNISSKKQCLMNDCKNTITKPTKATRELHKCKLCKRRFNFNSSLRHHLHIVHKIRNTEDSAQIKNTTALPSECQMNTTDVNLNIAESDFGDMDSVYSVKNSSAVLDDTNTQTTEMNTNVVILQNTSFRDSLTDEVVITISIPDTFISEDLVKENETTISNIIDSYVNLNETYLNQDMFATVHNIDSQYSAASQICSMNGNDLLENKLSLNTDEVNLKYTPIIFPTESNLKYSNSVNNPGENNFIDGVRQLCDQDSEFNKTVNKTEGVLDKNVSDATILDDSFSFLDTLNESLVNNSGSSSPHQMMEHNIWDSKNINEKQIFTPTRSENENCISQLQISSQSNQPKETQKCNIKLEKSTHKCEQCSSIFIKPSDLIRHERTHTGEKPFVCGLCDKGFSLKTTLKEHTKTHFPSDCIKVMCQVCGKYYAKKSSLKVHMLIHEKIKPFSCNVCFKKFRTSGHLGNHVQMHNKTGSLEL